MLNKAFDISFNDEEKHFYPKDYQLDTSLDNDIINFFKSQKNEENTCYLSKKTKNKKEKGKEEIVKHAMPNKEKNKKEESDDEYDNEIYIDNDNNDIENGEEDDESSSSSELIYSTFPNNIETTKNSIYEKMHINQDLTQAVIEEYSKTKDKFLKKINKELNTNISDNDKFEFSAKDFNKYNLPEDDIIINNILPFKTNEYLIKNINKCYKVLKNCNKNNKEEIKKLSEWFYTFLLFLEMPLSPDHCADLYSINKYIYNNFIKTTELKIIFIIICEIFKQILIL